MPCGHVSHCKVLLFQYLGKKHEIHFYPFQNGVVDGHVFCAEIELTATGVIFRGFTTTGLIATGATETGLIATGVTAVGWIETVDELIAIDPSLTHIKVVLSNLKPFLHFRHCLLDTS